MVIGSIDTYAATESNYVEENEMDDNKLSNDDKTSDPGVLQFLTDIFLKGQHEDEPINIGVADVPVLLSSRSGQTYHKNVVVYHGTFNNYECDLIVPYSSYSSLDIINDNLVNLGGSSVTGKILYDGDVLTPSDYDSYVYIMNPIYGNTSSVYQYGSFNYRRHYYLNTSSGYNRITYDDMYGNFTVDDVDVYYSTSERVYYMLLVMFLFMGVIFLWLRRH